MTSLEDRIVERVGADRLKCAECQAPFTVTASEIVTGEGCRHISVFQEWANIMEEASNLPCEYAHPIKPDLQCDLNLGHTGQHSAEAVLDEIDPELSRYWWSEP